MIFGYGNSSKEPHSKRLSNRLLAKILLVKESGKSDDDAKTAVLTDIQSVYRKIDSNLSLITDNEQA